MITPRYILLSEFAAQTFVEKSWHGICRLVLARKVFSHVNARDVHGKTSSLLASAGELAKLCEAVLRKHGFVAAHAGVRRGRTALNVPKHGN